MLQRYKCHWHGSRLWRLGNRACADVKHNPTAHRHPDTLKRHRTFSSEWAVRLTTTVIARRSRTSPAVLLDHCRCARYLLIVCAAPRSVRAAAGPSAQCSAALQVRPKHLYYSQLSSPSPAPRAPPRFIPATPPTTLADIASRPLARRFPRICCPSRPAALPALIALPPRSAAATPTSRRHLRRRHRPAIHDRFNNYHYAGLFLQSTVQASSAACWHSSAAHIRAAFSHPPTARTVCSKPRRRQGQYRDARQQSRALRETTYTNTSGSWAGASATRHTLGDVRAAATLRASSATQPAVLTRPCVPHRCSCECRCLLSTSKSCVPRHLAASFARPRLPHHCRSSGAAQRPRVETCIYGERSLLTPRTAVKARPL